jgi:hypothetical protein
MSKIENNDLNNDISCSSSSVGPAKVNIGIMPIFNQLRLIPVLHDARMEDKMDALDLSIGIKGQKKFVNYGRLDAKARKAKDIEDTIQENNEQLIEEDQHFLRAIHLAKRLIDTDPGLDSWTQKKEKSL